MPTRPTAPAALAVARNYARETIAGHPDLLADARAWLIDCGADPDLVADATPRALAREVDRHYEGGAAAFCRDSVPAPRPATLAERGQ